VTWFGVRCVFEVESGWFEERVTLWQATDFEDAIAQAEEEAAAYDLAIGSRYLGLAQAFRFDGNPDKGVEVFSLIRESKESPSDYLSKFFDTGSEIQGNAT
jgi:hypothetical protein